MSSKLFQKTFKNLLKNHSQKNDKKKCLYEWNEDGILFYEKDDCTIVL